ncbi:hypothetical protein CAPTEDRAFT_214390 [Capitella teleta]|uniref:Gustatory receptor n=1 Tax=Capitella teleta TaxID=283909 RepID=R7TG78_CAPTE|nr:hypothetical protein CAPTEDRAFT_214390 [Capitella teleta]|eukprot:ELT92788.1 hypothetical protein CAPTEDRAFT_214390 [Capitella teleta]
MAVAAQEYPLEEPSAEMNTPDGHSSDPSEDTNELCLSMRPLMRSMKVLGAIHLKGKRWTASRFYMVGVTVLVVAFQVKMCSVFITPKKIGPGLFMDVTLYVFLLNATVFHISMCRACVCSQRLRRVFAAWKKINQTANGQWLSVFQKKCWLHVVMAWMFIIMSNVCSMYGLIETSLFDALISPLDAHSAHVNLARGVYIVLHSYIVGSWTLIYWLMVHFTQVAHHEFKAFNTEFRSRISADGAFDGDLEDFRKRHQLICRFLEDADACFSFAHATNIVCFVMVLVLVLYNLIWWDDLANNTILVVINCAWLFIAASSLGLVVVCAAFVNDEAHGLVSDLHDISLANTSDDFRCQINTFHSRLTGPPIGFTALSIFTINKGIILTVVGILVSYFVVIVQFSPAFNTSAESSQCNQTITIQP